jgi:hypothetical protein
MAAIFLGSVQIRSEYLLPGINRAFSFNTALLQPLKRYCYCTPDSVRLELLLFLVSRFPELVSAFLTRRARELALEGKSLLLP